MLEDDQFNLFLKILGEGWITHPPHSPNISGNLTINTLSAISSNEMYSPEITCFADIPLQDISLHMGKYSSIGMSFSKNFIADAGGVPVHYLSTESKVRRLKNLSSEEIYSIVNKYGGDKLNEHMHETLPKGVYFDDMLREYHELFRMFEHMERQQSTTPGVSELSKRIRALQSFFEFHIFSYFKFFDHRKSDDDPDNYYFEREWRIVGNLQFTLADVKTVLFPEKYSKAFRESFPLYAGQVVFTD
jgi:hypothetical protein